MLPEDGADMHHKLGKRDPARARGCLACDACGVHVTPADIPLGAIDEPEELSCHRQSVEAVVRSSHVACKVDREEAPEPPRAPRS